MMKLLSKSRWAVFDCLTGGYTPLERLPFEIGSEPGADLRLNGTDVAGRQCALAQVKGHGLCLVRRDPDGLFRVNGATADLAPIKAETDYSLQVGSHFLLVRGGRDLARWRSGLDAALWRLFNPVTRAFEGDMPLMDLCRHAHRLGYDPGTVLLPKGADMGFYLHHMVAALAPELAAEPAPPAAAAADSRPPLAPSGDAGRFTCPVCWLKFDAGDVMHVAVHDSLRGDPVLGPDAPLRFHATAFNDRGQALDAFGLPCTEITCPHCRRVLSPGFLDTRHHIFSIVGDQSAGKSYYLSVLVKLLPASLYRHFGVVFQDADPAGNAMLNEMKRTLFGAQTPEEARLVKTQLEGAMYERLPRYGRIVALPKPFVYHLSAGAAPTRRSSVIFYDNAGEHFQPGRDSADSPGAQHVASSAGILFLFDPFNNPEFRRRMTEHNDPQLERPILDQQDVILSELKVRVQRLLNLPISDKISAPLAVLVGKCDAWQQWLGAEPFEDPLAGGGFKLAAAERNSDKVRRLLCDLAPTIVGNAEAVSRHVRYFPVSAFGHPPVKVGSGDYVPDPQRLSPILVEAPLLWLLSSLMPELVPAG
jgi:hypothetical protein